MADDPEDSYSVGRSKPPKSTQFKPGQSGNARGRPRGSKNMSTVVREEMDAKLAVTENGRRKRITKREALIKRLINSAIAGDTRATSVLMKQEQQKEGATGNQEGTLSEADHLTISNVVERMREALREELQEQAKPDSQGAGETGDIAQPISIPTEANKGTIAK